MPLLIATPAMKKASTEDLIATMQKISNILMEREINDPDFDIDQVFRVLLAHQCFNSPRDIKEPFVVSNNTIAIPSTMPKKDAKGNTKGDSVVPLIQIPGSEPYSGFAEETETFVDKRTVNLRGGRSVTLHRVVPGMIVSFHHYADEGGLHRSRTSIDATRISYDDNNELVFETLSEEDALFNMPDNNISQ